MSQHGASSIHASAVLVGAAAVLIRGCSGSGKSRLAWELILAGRAGQLPPTILIGDDRVHCQPGDAGLVVRPAPALAGLIEIRGLGIRRMPHAASGRVGLVVDLDAADAARLPAPDALTTVLTGVAVGRLPVAAGADALPLVLAALTTAAEPGIDPGATFGGDCLQGFGNHMNPTLGTE